MLDYDALRSKVRSLTEKPDKDPGKLPRTEKELEMVSIQHFLATAPPSPDPHHAATENTEFLESLVEDLDLSMPSPPKALQRPDISSLKSATRPDRMSLIRTSSLVGRSMSLRSFRRASKDLTDGPASLRSASVMATDGPDPIDNTAETGPPLTALDTSPTHKPSSRLASRPTPFFQPSELEDIMAPLREEFIQKQADDFAQAKAVYEQLNDQLTTELPQLIDLRHVSFLKPSWNVDY